MKALISLEQSMKTIIGYFIIFLTLSLANSCSVKEIRDACPCRVDFDLSKILAQDETGPYSGRDIAVAVYNSSGTKVYDRMFGADTCAGVYEASLPRGIYTVSALSVRNAGQPVPETIGPSVGGDVDSLYGISTVTDATGEESYVTLEPFKQFTTLSIIIISDPANIEICLDASSSSISRASLQSVGGSYEWRCLYGGKAAGFRIPRQGSGYDLVLSFIDRTSGDLITSINLGEKLKAIGYDFYAKSLADIILIADLNEGTASIKVEGWKENLLFVIF